MMHPRLRLRLVLKPRLWPGFTSGIQLMLCIVPALITLLVGLLITRMLLAGSVAAVDNERNELLKEIAGLTQELHAGISASDVLRQRLTAFLVADRVYRHGSGPGWQLDSISDLANAAGLQVDTMQTGELVAGRRVLTTILRGEARAAMRFFADLWAAEPGVSLGDFQVRPDPVGAQRIIKASLSVPGRIGTVATQRNSPGHRFVGFLESHGRRRQLLANAQGELHAVDDSSVEHKQ